MNYFIILILSITTVISNIRPSANNISPINRISTIAIFNCYRFLYGNRIMNVPALI